MASFYQATRMKENMVKMLLQQQGIMGIGVGYADPRHPEKGAAVILYTLKSISGETENRLAEAAAQLSKEHVPLRRIVSGHFLSRHATGKASRRVAQFRGRIRPLPAGYSIGTQNPTISGTAGLIVIDTSINQLFILSAGSVLNRNNSFGFSVTLQPGPANGGRQLADVIGGLERIHVLRSTGNLLDAGLASPLDNRVLSPTYAGVGSLPGHVTGYRVGEQFKKSGSASGQVQGVVEAVNVTINVNFGTYGGLGIVQFVNQSIIRSLTAAPITFPGDAGAVWLRSNDNFAAAMEYASSTGGIRSVAYPVDRAMSLFNVRVAAGPRQSGRVKVVDNQRNYAYTRPLTRKQLEGIKVVSRRK